MVSGFKKEFFRGNIYLKNGCAVKSTPVFSIFSMFSMEEFEKDKMSCA
jgi:hypothetical protein